MRRPSTCFTWSGSNGSIIRYSFAIRRIHLSDLILITMCFGALSLLKNESHILDGKAQRTKQKYVLHYIDDTITDGEMEVRSARSRSPAYCSFSDSWL